MGQKLAIEPDDQLLKVKQERAIAALVSEPTISAAAIKAGIGERTLHTWLTDPDFKKAYRKAQRVVTEHAITSLQKSTVQAIEVITKIMNDPQEKSTTRIMASKIMLENGLKGLELEDLGQRIEELEQNTQR